MKTIFVPTDLSANSTNALRYAIHLAKQSASEKIVLFHHNPMVYTSDIPVLYMDDLTSLNSELKENLEKDILRLLESMHGMNPDLSTEVIVTTEAGTITAIAEHARKSKANLIVMGTHGKTGLSRLVLGSVTAGVIEVSSVPVLAIPEGYRFKNVENVSYASSLHHFQKEFHLVKAFTRALDVAVSVVHMRYPHFDNNYISHAKHVLAEDLETHTQLDVIDTPPEIRLVDQLLVYMRKTSPDWLVMFPEKRDWYDKIFLSSKTLEVMSEFRRPLLVLHR
jgi:nucleotide-binding universal stress UspA family protein